MTVMEVVDRELLHMAWGFVLCEGLWVLFYMLLRLKRKRKLHGKLLWLIPEHYMALYGMAIVSILIGALLRELWDLTWGNNPSWKSWLDVFFWLVGVLAAGFWGYRKRWMVLQWVE